jgi:hypothetical protein
MFVLACMRWQSEARHFVHMHMQHLAIIVWKYEPDPAPAPDHLPAPEQHGQHGPPAIAAAASGGGGGAVGGGRGAGRV